MGPLDLVVQRGTILGLAGESGSGKTLTLRALAGIPPAGLIAEVSRYHRCAMVFQDPGSYFNPRWRVARSIDEVLQVVRMLPRESISAQRCALLEDVGLNGSDGQLYPRQMSGGMLQRAAIAMALATAPEVLLADEATSALDPATRDRILALLKRVAREHDIAVVVVSHDLENLAGTADRVVVLYRGVAVEEGEGRVLVEEPRHRYMELLVRARPGRHTRGTVLPVIRPADVSQGQWETGCPFAQRCPRAEQRCHEAMPPWEGQENHRFRCFFPGGRNE